ncbi:MAG: LuxR C-terminal-related transcriptional regulator, partial [SAR202 cluster bacterium]|nr:LuxR C-terminal-related transcriptional regulator [SAR202 cluster bacterium]
AEQHAALRPLQGGFIDDGVSAIDQVMGLLARTMGNPEQAAAHFEDALTLCREGGYRPQLAWACCDYADLLLQTEDADLDNAMSLIDEGLAIVQDAGQRPLRERLAALRELAESRPSTAVPNSRRTGVDGFTARETDVLKLIAAGMSNQQIADELVISIHTVIFHVRNILSKIGAANRAEAAVYAAQRGLTEK